MFLTALVTAVSDAVEQMICHFSAAENQVHCSLLGDSSHTPACAQLALSKLCPALYAVLSDGLHPTLDTAFGSIQNSVWQVVEASAQQGEITELILYVMLAARSQDRNPVRALNFFNLSNPVSHISSQNLFSL
jgi:hypothetical protein